MKRWIITAIFSLLVVVASAQSVTITGQSNKTSTLIRLFAYEDLLNETGILLERIIAIAEVSVDEQTVVEEAS